MLPIRQNFIEILLLFCACLLLFTYGLSSQEVIGFDSRFYLFAQEMWYQGASWFPTIYDQPYPDYPPTSTWFIYLLACFFGEINKWVAVLPSAILATLTIIFTYLIGALHQKRWGFFAVFFLLLTVTFIKSARSISLDLYPTFITTFCFYLIYSADKEKKPVRLVWIYFLFVLGFAMRGPIGLIIPTGVVCTYYLLDKKIKKFFLVGSGAFILLLCCSAILLSLAYYVGGNTFMHDVLRMEVLGRMDNHFLPRYFYFTNSLSSYALAFPFSVLVMFGIIFYVYKNKDDSPELRCLLKLAGWMSVVLIGMSLPDDKKVRYILPMLPAVALIAAYPLIAPSSQRYFACLRSITLWIFLVLPLLLLLTISTIYYYANHEVLYNLSYISIIVVFIIFQAINFIIFYAVKNGETWIFGVASLSFVFVYLSMIEPIELFINRAHDFVMKVEMQRQQHQARLVFYKERPDGLPIKYLINMPEMVKPEFIHQENDLLLFKAPAFFITSQSYFNEMPKELTTQFNILAKESLGHVPVVVFIKKGML